MEVIMAVDKIDIECCNEEKSYVSMDEVAALLVDLYGEYRVSTGGFSSEKAKNYAKAVGIAIRMLSD